MGKVMRSPRLLLFCLVAAAAVFGFSQTGSALTGLEGFVAKDVPRRPVGPAMTFGEIRVQVEAKQREAREQSAAAQRLWDKHSEINNRLAEAQRQQAGDSGIMVMEPRERAELIQELSRLRAAAKPLDAEAKRLSDEAMALIRRELQSVDAIIKAEAATAQSAKQAAETARKVDEALSKAVQTLAVNAEISNLYAITNDTDKILSQLETTYDKSMLGAYLHDKMTTLLNSDGLFCAAAARCALPADQRRPLDANQINSTLFHGAQPRRSQPKGTVR